MSRKLSDDLNNPYLFSEHQEGVYEYGENGVGGKTATGSLRIAEEPSRDGKAQSAAGGESRRGNDHEWGADDGGHLIGARFGGETGEANLTAQNRNLNRSDYKHMENEWAAHIEAGDKVFVHIETDDAQRPNAYMGYVIYESPDGTRDYDTFHMVNESRSEIAQWEADAEAFEASQSYSDIGSKAQESTSDMATDYIGEVSTSVASENNSENGYLGTAVSVETSSENSQSSESAMDTDSSMEND